MGVLAESSDGVLMADTDYLGTVSGGGYVGYFLDSHMLGQLSDTAELSYKSLFARCIPR